MTRHATSNSKPTTKEENRNRILPSRLRKEVNRSDGFPKPGDLIQAPSGQIGEYVQLSVKDVYRIGILMHEADGTYENPVKMAASFNSATIGAEVPITYSIIPRPETKRDYWHR